MQTETQDSTDCNNSFFKICSKTKCVPISFLNRGDLYAMKNRPYLQQLNGKWISNQGTEHEQCYDKVILFSQTQHVYNH